MAAAAFVHLPTPSLSSVASSPRASPPPSLSNPSLPSRAGFMKAVEDHILTLDPKKQPKNMFRDHHFAMVYRALTHPTDTTNGSTQDRFWARADFLLGQDEHGQLDGTLLHNSKPVRDKKERLLPIVRENEIFDVIARAHQDGGHCGRDKTFEFITKRKAYLNKQWVCIFIKLCPTCNAKRTTVKGPREISYKTAPKRKRTPTLSPSPSRSSSPILDNILPTPPTSVAPCSPHKLDWALPPLSDAQPTASPPENLVAETVPSSPIPSTFSGHFTAPRCANTPRFAPAAISNERIGNMCLPLSEAGNESFSSEIYAGSLPERIPPVVLRQAPTSPVLVSPDTSLDFSDSEDHSLPPTPFLSSSPSFRPPILLPTPASIKAQHPDLANTLLAAPASHDDDDALLPFELSGASFSSPSLFSSRSPPMSEDDVFSAFVDFSSCSDATDEDEDAWETRSAGGFGEMAAKSKKRGRGDEEEEYEYEGKRRRASL
ncbi:hypothetical protein JCM8547_005253 [Rhodosporidiobolus lusitaniae]